MTLPGDWPLTDPSSSFPFFTVLLIKGQFWFLVHRDHQTFHAISLQGSDQSKRKMHSLTEWEIPVSLLMKE